MNISTLLMEQIIQLFLMIFMGYLIVKVGLVKDEDSKVLSKIILYLIIPCVIINAFQVDYTMDTVKGLLLALAASVMTQVLPSLIYILNYILNHNLTFLISVQYMFSLSFDVFEIPFIYAAFLSFRRFYLFNFKFKKHMFSSEIRLTLDNSV